MLEWLAAATGIELGKFVLEQVLNLGKAALEDYVKDFFKDCIQSGVAQANADALKKPMAEAIGFFIKRFVKELQINEVPETSINHHYKAAIKRFVQDKAVRPILGKAFEKNCKQIDYAQLEKIWMDSYQMDGWQFPADEFDWRGVGKEYVYEVKGIVKANSELRSLLDTELLEDIARNTAQISPGFDVVRYRESLQCSYGYLKLYTLDSTDRVDAIKLWSMFIEQTVREALPPTRYELPLDLKRRLQEEGQLGDDLSPEALEHYRREYFQQPAQKVLEAVADTPRAVILGDPGSGKSSLLQYLALEWVEGKTEMLPLLIELREFALAQSGSFLEFLHRGRGVDWQFDQQQLHQHLLENPTLVMFDGLDEVFDRATQATVIDDIVRFSRQYPKTRVLVTSRIIGYNPERLRHAEFQHFTLQSLDTDEIHEFIDRWYDLSMGNDPDKVRFKQRLKEAIANSKAIQNLADNPLLLTMMAILNRRQELPRDRADLYDQASRVLLYHWDVDHKRLQLPMDAIGRREKQEMLRLIAYEMQAGEEGLKGNLLSIERLMQVLTGYLHEQGFSEPREKSSHLIKQLRERNFILCYRGADTYGFVHRTFLEYFCAVEILQRFEKQRSISFEKLRDEIYGQHWQDENWHEVLRLISGMLDTSFLKEIIEYLLSRHNDNSFSALVLAATCIAEVKNKSQISETAEKLLIQLKKFVEYKSYMLATRDSNLDGDEFLYLIRVCTQVVFVVSEVWKDHPDTLPWIKRRAESQTSEIRIAALRALAKFWREDKATSSLLISYLLKKEDWEVKVVAVRELARYWNHDRQVFEILKEVTRYFDEPNVQQVAIQELARRWKDEQDTLPILKECSTSEKYFFGVRSEAVTELANSWFSESWMFNFLREVSLNDPFVREHTSNRNPRLRALQALLTYYPVNSESVELLYNRATNDTDPQLREWAQQQLVQLKQLRKT